MESSNTALDAFAKVKQALEPYIKSQQEASRIRRVLATHLDRQFKYKAGHPRLSPLSLPSDSTSVTPTSENLQGLQKDYVKSVQANVKARQEYDRLCDAATIRTGDSRSQRTLTTDVKYLITNSPERRDLLHDYIDLVRQRHRHERLRILQDYLDKFEQKFTAATSYLDQATTSALPLPEVPVDLLASSDANTPESARRDLQALTIGLERAVLRAKIQLRHEKLRLEHVREFQNSHQRVEQTSARVQVNRLQALGQTRSELIRWIEKELGKAGESTPQNHDDKIIRSKAENAVSNVQRLSSIKAQYSRYVDLRTTFLEAVCDQGNPVPYSITSPIEEANLESSEKDNAPTETRVALPLLKDLLSISNEQKSLIQQKSHFTVSLAKQHKETNLTIDRLVNESHLLPAFALSARKASRRGLGQVDADEPLGKEMPDTAHRASSWIQAADLASSAMKDAVLNNLEDGELAIESSRQLLSKLEQLLPQNSLSQPERLEKEDTDVEDIWMSDKTLIRPNAKRPILQPQPSTYSRDIWALLDGNLGVLQVDHGD